jgi:hypothetical protein
MNTTLIDALVKAVLALSPEEQELFQQKLQDETPIEAEPIDQVPSGQEEQIQQQDEFLQTHSPNQTAPTPSSGEPILGGSKASDLLKFAGTWQGDDFEECLQLVYETRSQAEF